MNIMNNILMYDTKFVLITSSGKIKANIMTLTNLPSNFCNFRQC